MSLLNYSITIAPPTGNDVLGAIYSFANYAGWHIDEYRTGVLWADTGGGVYGWTTGTESFLEMHTHGYGNQETHYRFRCYNNTAYNYNYYNYGPMYIVKCAIVDPANLAYTTSSTHPQRQNTMLYPDMYGYTSEFINEDWVLCGSPGLKQWIFGNDKFIWCTVQYDPRITTHLTFGVSELFDTTSSVFKGFLMKTTALPLEMYYMDQYSPGRSAAQNFGPLAQIVDGACAYTTVPYPDSSYGRAIRSVSSFGALFSGYQAIPDLPLHEALRHNNSWSYRKPIMLRDTHFAARWLAGRTVERFYPVGQPPYYMTVVKNMNFGEVFTYGAEEYMTVPWWGPGYQSYKISNDIDGYAHPENYYGFAFRIK